MSKETYDNGDHLNVISQHQSVALDGRDRDRLAQNRNHVPALPPQLPDGVLKIENGLALCHL